MVFFRALHVVTASGEFFLIFLNLKFRIFLNLIFIDLVFFFLLARVLEYTLILREVIWTFLLLIIMSSELKLCLVGGPGGGGISA